MEPLLDMYTLNDFSRRSLVHHRNLEANDGFLLNKLWKRTPQPQFWIIPREPISPIAIVIQQNSKAGALRDTD